MGIDFPEFFRYDEDNQADQRQNILEGSPMKTNGLKGIIGIIALASVVAAAVATVILFFEKKKKDEAELEEYLDCSIQ
jgi:hypothetical protein